MLRTVTMHDIVNYADNNCNPNIRKQRFIREQPKLTKDLKVVVRLARRFQKREDIIKIFVEYICIMYAHVFHSTFIAEQPHLVELVHSTTNMFNTKNRLIESMVDNVFIIYDILKKVNNILAN
jgi:hypothetical protein